MDEGTALACIQAVAQGRSTRKRFSLMRQQLVLLRSARLVECAGKEREDRMTVAAVTILRWGRHCLARRRAREATIVQELCRWSGYHGELDERGRPHGKGKWVEDGSGGWYEGEWVGGVRHGSGRRMWADGAMYEGEWTDGAMQGTGSHVASNGLVRRHGAWAAAAQHGEGTMVVESAQGGVECSYAGQFERGLRHGAGRETRGEGGEAEGGEGSEGSEEVYEGQWQHDLRHGVGTAACCTRRPGTSHTSPHHTTLLATCGQVSPALAALRTRDEPPSRSGPSGRLRCGREAPATVADSSAVNTQAPPPPRGQRT